MPAPSMRSTSAAAASSPPSRYTAAITDSIASHSTEGLKRSPSVSALPDMRRHSPSPSSRAQAASDLSHTSSARHLVSTPSPISRSRSNSRRLTHSSSTASPRNSSRWLLGQPCSSA